MVFTIAAKILAYLLLLVGAFSTYQGFRIALDIGVVEESNGLPVGAKVALLSHGILIFCAGIAMGVLSEISATMHRTLRKISAKD